MPPVSGSTVVAPTAGQVLVEATFPWARHLRLTLTLSCTYNFDAILEVWDAQGNVLWDMTLPVLAPLWSSPTIGIRVPTNGRVRVISRNTPVTPGTLEVQATLDFTDWAER